MDTKIELQKLIDELDASIGKDPLRKDLSEKLQKVKALLNQLNQPKNGEKSQLTSEKE